MSAQKTVTRIIATVGNTCNTLTYVSVMKLNTQVNLCYMVKECRMGTHMLIEISYTQHSYPLHLLLQIQFLCLFEIVISISLIALLQIPSCSLKLVRNMCMYILWKQDYLQHNCGCHYNDLYCGFHQTWSICSDHLCDIALGIANNAFVLMFSRSLCDIPHSQDVVIAYLRVGRLSM